MSKEKIKSETAQKIVNILAEVKGLTITDGAEILMACNSLIKEKTFQAMAEQEKMLISESLGHLNRSDIKIVHG